MAQERILVQRAQAGDRASFAELYRLHADRLYRQVIYPTLPNEALAEDILKETFVTFMKQIEHFQWDEQRGLFPWLARVARNRALDQHRKASREARGQGAYRQELDQLAPTPNPAQLLEAHEEEILLKERVQVCLNQLNERYRLALEWRMFQEFSREECARRFQIQVGTFDVLFHRALQSFRKIWDRQEEAL